jgi:hypothetical protein
VYFSFCSTGLFPGLGSYVCSLYSLFSILMKDRPPAISFKKKICGCANAPRRDRNARHGAKTLLTNVSVVVLATLARRNEPGRVRTRTRRLRRWGRMGARRGTAGARRGRSARPTAAPRGGSTTAPAICPWTPPRWLQVRHSRQRKHVISCQYAC